MTKHTVYVIWDDFYHPRINYAPIVTKLFENEEWELTTICDAREILALDIVPDLVVSFTVGCPEGAKPLTYSEQEGFKLLVEKGMGMLFVHAGLACVCEYTPFYEIALGHFASHPEPRYPTLVCALPGIAHPILQNVEPFEERDEHYFCKVDIQKATPFLCSVSQAGTEIAGWTQCLGKGRVACLTQGHTSEMLQKMAALLLNACRWCTYQI